MADVTKSPTGPKPVSQAEVEAAVTAAQNHGAQQPDNGASGATDNKGTTATEASAAKPAKVEQPTKAKEESKKDDPPETMGDDDELPKDENALLKPMTLKSFMRRVGSMSRANLRKWFGTDDVEKIIEERKELEAFRKEKAEREKAAMTETDRLKAEKAEAEERAKQAEEKAQRKIERAVSREVESDLRAYVRTLVDDADVDDMLDKMARTATKEGFTKVKQIKEWASGYIEKHPKWKRGGKAEEKKPEGKAEEKKPEGKTPEVRRVMLSNGSRRVGESRPTPAKEGEQPLLGKLTKEQIFQQTGLKL